MDISPEAWNTHYTIRRQHEVQDIEDQNVDASVLFRRRNKVVKVANMETKCRIETEEKAIQRLPNLGIHPIYRQQTQTLLWMPRSAC